MRQPSKTSAAAVGVMSFYFWWGEDVVENEGGSQCRNAKGINRAFEMRRIFSTSCYRPLIFTSTGPKVKAVSR
jgi:hypothetical protein